PPRVPDLHSSLTRRSSDLPVRLAAKPFDLAGRVTGKDLPITSARVHKLSEAETAFTADRIRQVGFTPSVTLPEGVATMVRWYQQDRKSTRLNSSHVSISYA